MNWSPVSLPVTIYVTQRAANLPGIDNGNDDDDDEVRWVDGIFFGKGCERVLELEIALPKPVLSSAQIVIINGRRELSCGCLTPLLNLWSHHHHQLGSIWRSCLDISR